MQIQCHFELFLGRSYNVEAHLPDTKKALFCSFACKCDTKKGTFFGHLHVNATQKRHFFCSFACECDTKKAPFLLICMRMRTKQSTFFCSFACKCDTKKTLFCSFACKWGTKKHLFLFLRNLFKTYFVELLPKTVLRSVYGRYSRFSSMFVISLRRKCLML